MSRNKRREGGREGGRDGGRKGKGKEGKVRCFPPALKGYRGKGGREGGREREGKKDGSIYLYCHACLLWNMVNMIIILNTRSLLQQTRDHHQCLNLPHISHIYWLRPNLLTQSVALLVHHQNWFSRGERQTSVSTRLAPKPTLVMNDQCDRSRQQIWPRPIYMTNLGVD
jgi:hypothetical protein